MRNTDLSRADLTKAMLDDADLAGATLAKARLDGAQIERADFSFADLREAQMIDVDKALGASYDGAKLQANCCVELCAVIFLSQPPGYHQVATRVFHTDFADMARVG